MGTNYHFHSWRVFVIVCALPATVSMVALKFMPESPRFLLEVSPCQPQESWPSSLSPWLCVLSSLLAAHFPLLMTLPVTKFASLPLGDCGRSGIGAHGTTGRNPPSGLEGTEGQVLVCLMVLSPHRGPE